MYMHKLKDYVCYRDIEERLYDYYPQAAMLCSQLTRLQLLLDSHKAHGPPSGQAILYISPVDVLALY